MQKMFFVTVKWLNSLVSNISCSIRSDKMIVLEKYKWLQKAIGMDPIGERYNIILRFLFSVLFASFNSMVSIFCILNIHGGIEQTSAILPAICGVMSAMLTYWHQLINRKQFYSILFDLQKIVKERKCIEKTRI